MDNQTNRTSQETTTTAQIKGFKVQQKHWKISNGSMCSVRGILGALGRTTVRTVTLIDYAKVIYCLMNECLVELSHSFTNIVHICEWLQSTHTHTYIHTHCSPRFGPLLNWARASGDEIAARTRDSNEAAKVTGGSATLGMVVSVIRSESEQSAEIFQSTPIRPSGVIFGLVCARTWSRISNRVQSERESEQSYLSSI